MSLIKLKRTIRLANVVQPDTDSDRIPRSSSPRPLATADRVPIVGIARTPRCGLTVAIPLTDGRRQVVVDFTLAFGSEHEACRKAVVATVLTASGAGFCSFKTEASALGLNP